MLWDVVYPDDEPDSELLDGDELRVAGTRLRVLHTPGHSPGGVCLLSPDGHVFGGDTLFKGGPGATGRSYSDFDTIITSIRDRLFTPARRHRRPHRPRRLHHGRRRAPPPRRMDHPRPLSHGHKRDIRCRGVRSYRATSVRDWIPDIGSWRDISRDAPRTRTRGGSCRRGVPAGGRGRARRRGSCGSRRCRRRWSR